MGRGGGGVPAPSGGTDASRDMDAFFARVEEVKADMGEIKGRQREISAAHERGKTIVRQKEVQRHREEMQRSINDVNALAHKVKAKVDALDKANEAALAKKGQGQGSASERTRTSITAGERVVLCVCVCVTERAVMPRPLRFVPEPRRSTPKKHPPNNPPIPPNTTTTPKGLKKKLKDLMGEFSELRARIHDEYREVGGVLVCVQGV
jgi:hypothetical protein